MNPSQPYKDTDLSVPDQTWAILLISILGLFLETLFIRWIGTEIRIFAYLQNTIPKESEKNIIPESAG